MDCNCSTTIAAQLASFRCQPAHLPCACPGARVLAAASVAEPAGSVFRVQSLATNCLRYCLQASTAGNWTHLNICRARSIQVLLLLRLLLPGVPDLLLRLLRLLMLTVSRLLLSLLLLLVLLLMLLLLQLLNLPLLLLLLLKVQLMLLLPLRLLLSLRLLQLQVRSMLLCLLLRLLLHVELLHLLLHLDLLAKWWRCARMHLRCWWPAARANGRCQGPKCPGVDHKPLESQTTCARCDMCQQIARAHPKFVVHSPRGRRGTTAWLNIR